MSRTLVSGNGRRVLVAIFAVAVVATMSLLPRTATRAAKTSSERTESHQDGFLNYDIRIDKYAVEKLASFRTAAGKNAPDIADARDLMVRGEENLKQRTPTIKIEYNLDLQIPEVIAPDVKQGRVFLTRPSSGNRVDTLKNFLNQNNDLIGARRGQVDQLKVFSDYSNPDGQLAFVELDQEINGIPVFRGAIKAGFTQTGEIVRVINNFAPDLDETELSADFGDPANALRAAAGHIGNQNLSQLSLRPDQRMSSDQKAVFGDDSSAPTAEKIYFPTEPGVAIPAWRVLIWQPVNAYYVIVDAASGTLLWRKNLTEDQTQSATYSVYANPNAMINVADSPFPMTPGPSSPNGTQGTAIARTQITRVGNEAPYTFNNLGWITDGNNTLDGNNVQAGLDREAPNDGSLNANAIDPGSVPSGSPDRVFNFPINPSVPSNPALNTGDSPLPSGQNPQTCLSEGTNAVPTDFQRAVVTQLFYITNAFHDETYRLGFTEAARNFQNDNFGRGGLGGDRISAQAQDCSGINNANFSTPGDGARPQMQMYLWQGPNPDIDGSLDADVIVHELTHGLSNRLHGNGDGLFLDIARGMGEGWSDFYAGCLLSEPTDPLDGVYTTGGYDTYLFGTVGFNNYYYGIRRFPRAIMSSVGGPSGRPHNPLTFQDIDSSKLDISDGAFNPRFFATADQVHAIGEVWSSALWEIRARFIQRLGWEAGNRRILQFVTDGMKLAPLGPTPLTERDAMIAAIFASGTDADLADAWAGFARRGFGFSASIEALGGISTGGSNQIRVTESFDPPNLVVGTVEVSDVSGDNDGFPEPGEQVSLNFVITNATGTPAANTATQIGGGPFSGSATISGRGSVTIGTLYTIPASAICGSTLQIPISLTSSLGPISYERSIYIGRPATTAPSENFDGVTSPSLPAGWTAVAASGGINFVNATTQPDSAPNVLYARDPATVGGGTDLTAPPVSVTSSAATVSFRNSYNTENGWDGGVLEISIAGGGYQDFLAAGGTFLQNGYNGVMSGGRNNPIASRAGWTGNSNGYLTTIAQLPASALGRIVGLRWRFGADDNTTGTGPDPGWRIDNVILSGAGFVTSFACEVSAAQPTSISGRVLTPNGSAVRNAVVTLTDPQSAVRRVTTSSFGIFSFDQIQIGRRYTISVSTKRYRFAPQIIDVTGNVTNLDLLGQE